LEKNQKINLLDMLKSTPAHMKLDLYSADDLKDAADLIEQCLKWVPSERISAQDAFEHAFCKS